MAISSLLPERLLAILRRKWACALLVELLGGPKRFGDFARSVPGIKKGVLAGELLRLLRDGLVRKGELGSPRKGSYSLTPVGQQFCALLEQLRDWEERHIPPEGTGQEVTGHTP